MPYPLNNNDEVMINIFGRLHGQQTITTFPYYVDLASSTPIADGKTALETAVADFSAIVYEAFLECVSNEWTCEGVTIQKVQPQRYRLIKYLPSDLIGNVAGQSLPSSTAAVISRYAERAGRSYQGRIFVPAVPVLFEQDSSLNELAIATMATLATNMVAPISLGSGDALIPWIGHTGFTPTDSQVIETVVQTPLRVQRRREVGRGA